MTLNEKYAERIAELLGDAIRAAQDDGEFPDVDEISSYSDHYMSRDSGLFVQLANGAEIGIVVQAYTPFDEDDDDDAEALDAR